MKTCEARGCTRPADVAWLAEAVELCQWHTPMDV